MKKISKLLIGTNNKGKYREISDLLPKFIKTYSTTDFKLNSPKEDGLTFEENSIIKAKYFSKKTKLICLADDSGLEIDVLNKDWNQFASRIGNFELPRLTYLNGGVNYRVAPPGVEVKEGVLHVNTNYPGAKFTYTTDGKEPNLSSVEYSEPVSVTGKMVKVIAFYPNGKISRVEMSKSKHFK